MKNPEAYQKIKEEVDAVCGSDIISLDHISKLKYVDASLKETLRLKSTAPAWTLTPKDEETIIGGKYLVRKGEPLFILLDALHQDPTIWGDDAQHFRREPLR